MLRYILLVLLACCTPSSAATELPRGEVSGWLTLDQVIKFLGDLALSTPLVKAPIEIGRSFENRPIWAGCVGSCEDTDAAQLLITGMHHGREPLGMHAALSFVHWIVAASEAGSTAYAAQLRHAAIWVVPCVNPDAYQYNLDHFTSRKIMARKNVRHTCDESHASYEAQGVDLNRNYDFAWDINNQGSSPDPCAEDYRGTAPFSEPETLAIKNFVESRHFSIALNWHSFGRVTNLPYGTSAATPPSAEVFDTLLSLAKAYQHLTGWGYGHPGKKEPGIDLKCR